LTLYQMSYFIDERANTADEIRAELYAILNTQMKESERGVVCRTCNTIKITVSQFS